MKLIYFLKKDQICLGIETAVGIVDIDWYQATKKQKIVGSQNITSEDLKETAITAEKAIYHAEFILDEANLNNVSCVPHSTLTLKSLEQCVPRMLFDPVS